MASREQESEWEVARARLLRKMQIERQQFTAKLLFTKGDIPMNKGRLFQYAILFHPTEKEYEAGKRSILLVPVTNILAVDEKSAAMIAARSIPKDYEDKMEQIDLAIAPF